MKAIIVSGNRYEFTDENTGEVRKGASVMLLEVDGVAETSDNIGTKPVKMPCDIDHIESLRGLLPCLVNVGVSMRADAKLKASLRITSVDILQSFTWPEAVALVEGNKLSAKKGAA